MPKNKCETLCWNCKRATNGEGFECPWAARGKPVKGWKAEEGAIFEIPIHNSHGFREEQSYIVLECPLYIKDKKYETLADFLDEMERVLGVKKHSIYQNLPAKLALYEKTTNEPVPGWIKIRITEGRGV